MANTYTSSNVANGLTFDELLGKLLAYKPDQWGFTEQDYNEISADFGVSTNDLYYLPAGNYKMLNIPSSPFNSSFVNISVYDLGSSKYITCDIGSVEKYSATLNRTGETLKWTNISDNQRTGADAVLINVGTSAPADKTMLWVDTSKLATANEVSLKYHNGNTWVSYSFDGVMLQSVYDTQGLKKDPYKFVMDALEEFIGDNTEFIRHINDELTLIHINSEDREYYDTYLLTKSYLESYFAEGGELYNELVNYVNAKVKETSGIDITKTEELINELDAGFNAHLDGDGEDISKHITNDDIQRWNNKSAGDHGHSFDEKVTIPGSNVKPSETSKAFSIDRISDMAKDRAYLVDDISILASTPSAADLAGKYHNGNTLYTENDDGSTTWWKIVDNTQFGKTGFRGIEYKLSNVSRTWQGICYGADKFVAVSQSNTFAYSTDGVTWHEVPVGDAIRAWRGVCYGGDKFVAVSTDSVFAYSTDGITWHEVTASDTIRPWRHVCYGNGKFVAVSGSTNLSDVFAYSTDGITWHEVIVSNTPRDWWNVCYGNGKFIAITYTKAIFAYSPDGITWTEVIVNEDDYGWRGICYGNGKYLVTGFIKNSENVNIPAVAYSTNASDWTVKTINDKVGVLNNVCYGDKYVATVNNSNMFAYSTDGITWTFEQATYRFDNRLWQYICYHDGKYAATISNESVITLFANDNPTFYDGLKSFGNAIMDVIFSDLRDTPTTLAEYGIIDGATTEDLSVLNSLVEDNLYVHYTPEEYSVEKVGNNDLYIGIQKSILNHGGGTDNYPMSTTNADLDVIMVVDKQGDLSTNVSKFNCESIKRWTEAIISDTVREWSEICYGNGMYVAIAIDSTVFAYSYDGITWTEGNISTTAREWWTLCYGNGMFIAVAKYSDTIAYSYDGINWTETTVSDVVRPWWAICYGNDKYVMLSSGENVFAYSSDGINWIEGTISNTRRYWYSICYGNGMFVAIAAGDNAFAYSYDGINWTECTISDTKRDWHTVCYGGGKFVIIACDSNVFAYSEDGVVWNETIVSDTAKYWYHGCYGDDKFVALDYSSNVCIYSNDGINWYESTINDDVNFWYSICYGNGVYVAIATDSNKVASTDSIYTGSNLYSEPGLSKHDTDIPASTYFSTNYLIDSENPNWESDGLGRMLKVDTSVDNLVMHETYHINGSEYELIIRWNCNVGIVFDLSASNALRSSQMFYDNFDTDKEVIMNEINELSAILN